VLQFVRKNGWLRAGDLARADIPRVVPTRMTASGQLDRAARGHPPVNRVQFTGEACTHGIEIHERDGVKLQVYGTAKAVADCFKHRNKIGMGRGAGSAEGRPISGSQRRQGQLRRPLAERQGCTAP
jgi:hypothetical protein